jgi:hypothetical protein
MQREREATIAKEYADASNRCERAGLKLRALFRAVQALRGAGIGRSFATPLSGYMHLAANRRRMKERGMDAFDAVVVGAGHNGLAAAIHLLNRGWSVAVIEQAGEPGGAVKTRETTLPGFRHDLCAMNLSMFAGSPFFAAHKDELTAHGLAFAPAGDCFASVFRDHTFLGVSKDLEKTATAITALSAKDAAA